MQGNLSGLPLVRRSFLLGGGARPGTRLRPFCAHLMPVVGPATIAYVQFRKTENSWRLDRSHRRGHRCDTPRLVDAADVRTVKPNTATCREQIALKFRPLSIQFKSEAFATGRKMSEMGTAELGRGAICSVPTYGFTL